MTQIYINAIHILDSRIKTCGKGLQAALDQYTVSYWNNQMKLAQFRKSLVIKRINVRTNIILVDFQAKKRAA